MSERDSLTTQDDELGARLATLREVTPPPSLVPRVMQRIAVPARDTLWTWLRRPRRFELRMSPLALGGLAVAGLLFFALLARNPRPGQVLSARPTAVLPVVASAPEAEVVLVRFVLVTRGAHRVALAGDFNGWDPDHTLLDKAEGDGTFVANLWLTRGAHEYMFVVDGQWVPDPSAPSRIPDGFGRTNSLLWL
jgi:hypothetical protein